MKELLYDKIESEIGQILLVAEADTPVLVAVDFENYEARLHKLLQRHYNQFNLVEANNPYGFSQRLQAYLAGDMQVLDSIEVSTGGTVFQQQVWQLLRTIPAGTTATYGQLAAKLGNAGAARAVGLANSLNPVGIVIPCHRVIGANASLTGYAGGLERKQWLLAHEQRYAPATDYRSNGNTNRAALQLSFSTFDN